MRRRPSRGRLPVVTGSAVRVGLVVLLGGDTMAPPRADQRLGRGRTETGMAGKFEVYTDGQGQYRFRLKAGNGEVVATGEAYPSKDSALKGIEAVRRAASDAEVADLT
jgi:uncharacterized protein